MIVAAWKFLEVNIKQLREILDIIFDAVQWQVIYLCEDDEDEISHALVDGKSGHQDW